MYDHRQLYDSTSDYFSFGDSMMVLSPAAAKDVCELAASEGLVIARIEGGNWIEPGVFQPRGDFIWDGAEPPVSRDAAHANNLLAAAFVGACAPPLSAFVFTSSPISGWPHAISRSAP
ncbi:colicin immunity protein [Lysobacter niabensis]|uniref:colicin immunity protein n=1 Tax=Agrilutibacter niabensis TaxID=380628 RepID=UPI003614BBC0